MPKVFISYSWEDEDHKLWVRQFADSLIGEGIDVIVDQYDLTLGDRLPVFMEQSIISSDYVLIICTPVYKEKADNRKGGVGYEGHIISGELFAKSNEKKFIPVIRKGTVLNSMPAFLSGKLGVDLSEHSNYEINFRDLVTTIWGRNKKSVIRKNTEYIQFENCNKQETEDPIYILGIIVDEVMVPKLDGTRGSALYAIPFRLSRRPSELWKKIFLEAWKSPPSFSSMHRSGIAKVYEDKIILDGTTIEEVKNYHRDTLMLCVDLANKQENLIIEEKKREAELKKQKQEQHYSNVENIAKEIKF